MARTGRPKTDKPFDHKVTVKFKEDFSLWSLFGFTINFPSTYPTETAATGP